MSDLESPQEKKSGLIAGFGAYFFWGFLPIYWHQIKEASALEIASFRMAGSAIFLGLILLGTRRFNELKLILSQTKTILILVATSLLISINWLLFIWAINHGHMVESSLGYFINPLVNILLGSLILRERLRPWQLFSTMLAACGVCYLTWVVGKLPLIALVLAITFSLYGLLRKIVTAGPLVGLAVETFLIGPFTLVYLVYIYCIKRVDFFSYSSVTIVGLALAGAITALPLVAFAYAAKRLNYSTLGFLQYIAPTCGFLIATLIYHEPVHYRQFIGFSLIWIALIIYSIDAAWLIRIKSIKT